MERRTPCFAYGSNLDRAQLALRCPDARELGAAWLPEHRLAFRGPSRMRGKGVATVDPGGPGVPGALFELSPRDLRVLDRAEGHPFFYRRIGVEVELEGHRVQAVTYQLPVQVHRLAPSAAYLEQVRRAWRERELDADQVTRAVEGLPAAILFVYGSLRSGERNHHFLQGARPLGAGRTRPDHRLIDLGGYPGLVAGTRSIRGEVWAVDAHQLAAIDRLEDHPRSYRREVIRLDDGVPAETYLYTAGHGSPAQE